MTRSVNSRAQAQFNVETLILLSPKGDFDETYRKDKIITTILGLIPEALQLFRAHNQA